MNAPSRISPAPMDMFQRTEARLGRLDWTTDDYRRAGEEEFDRLYTESSSPWQPSQRDHYAHCYVLLNCPPSKRRAAAASQEGIAA